MSSNKVNQVHKELEERVELSMLYDFYGALLKEGQQRMYEAYILDDYSISEIADEEGITRQGVHDAVKRVTRQLREFEEKLGLVSKFEKQRKRIKELHSQLNQMQIAGQDSRWERIYSIIDHILEEEISSDS